MEIDENALNTMMTNVEGSAMVDPLGDAYGERFVIEYNDHNQALWHATVMMVDDEPTTLEILQAFLEEEGYQRFVTTSESTCALELIAHEKPDVVLLDLNMPEVTGFDILSAMRGHGTFRYIPVIVLTSSVDSDTKLKALQLGATDFLAKPVDPSELALRLRNTLAAKAYQDQLTYCDALTGLPNRRMFLDRLGWALQQAKRDGRRGAVLHIDLDRFQQINDSLGPRVGDGVLQGVAERLVRHVRMVDTVGRVQGNAAEMSLSRLGGDEFTVLLPAITRAEHASRVVHRILTALARPFHVASHEVFVTPSIGIAVFPDDGVDADTVLKHTDVALSHAKRRGRNTYAFYSAEMNAKALERLHLENELRKAPDRDELLLVYQPKVDVFTEHVVGAEALVRWNHPVLGAVSPEAFIPVAEETGLIVILGEWVLDTVCQQIKAWQAAGLGRPRIAVNVSSRQFREASFIHTLSQVLQRHGVEAHDLTVELTETMLMENAKENVHALQQLKDTGVTLSIDDFGTGYSSLSYLQQFPLDELKIDRAFLSAIQTDMDDSPIITAIIAMAHSLGLQVVAEGVESPQQLAFLRDRGCDMYQGYLYSQPVPSDAFAALITRGQAQPPRGDT